MSTASSATARTDTMYSKSIDKSVYRDVYDLHAEMLEKLGAPDFWDAVYWPRADALMQKHEHDVFFLEMMLALHGELERRWKQNDSR